MTGDDELPDALVGFLSIPALRQGWEGIAEPDRYRYAAWVAAPLSTRAARRRARVVVDRVRNGRGWVGQPRRRLEHLFYVPRGTSASDAYTADQRGDFPFGGGGSGE